MPMGSTSAVPTWIVVFIAAFVATGSTTVAARPFLAALLVPCSSSIAALCRSTCGVTRLDANDGHLSLATRTCLARSAWTLSALSVPPVHVGKQRHRSFRPLPTHRTCGAEMDGVPVEADQL
jgi:hypothetical protein